MNNQNSTKTPGFEAVASVVDVRMPCRSCGGLGFDPSLRK
jgi:hypothetical protein